VPFVPGKPRSAQVFWIGVFLLVLGVVIQTSEFLALRTGGNKTAMVGTIGGLGMAVNFIGLALAAWGVLPAGLFAGRRDADHAPASPAVPAPTVKSGEVAAMDEAGLTVVHAWVLLRLFIGLVFDTQKASTLAFMLPGLRAEYHLTPAIASLFPVLGLTGTVIGAVLFGRLGDWVGRRSSFVLTALVLASTAFCGFMPGFGWQISICFVMALAAGGELPLIYSMIVEMMPARHRGWSSVIIAGVGSVGGYLLASGAALLLEPSYSWRALWLPNLPTALLMLILIRWVPESPRLLLQTGHAAEARKAMAAMGVRVDASLDDAIPGAPAEKRRTVEVFQGKLLGTTLAMCLYGFAYGLINWGFITWLPTMLRQLPELQAVLQQDPAFVTRLLGTSALFALPGTAAAAALYAFWSSRGAMVVFALVAGAVLVTFGLAQSIVAASPSLIVLGVILLLISSSSMIGVLAPYSAELYPTILRGVGSGVIAASTRVGGVVGSALGGTLLTISAGLVLPSLVISVPIAAAALVMFARGVETRGRRLEELTPASSS
jgi:putative MFS transporter